MKHLKSYKVFEIRESPDLGGSDDAMRIKYGKEVIDKCDAVIEYIKEIFLPLEDLKFYCYVNYTPMTKCYQEVAPILFVDISQNPELTLSENDKTELEFTIESLKKYIESQHFFLTDYRFNDRGVEKYSARFYPKKMNMNENLSDDRLEWILKELCNEIQDAGLAVNIYFGNYKDSNHPKFDGRAHIEINDTNKIFCKNYPEDDMDWLYGKPIINNFIEELEVHGFIRDKDYRIYAGGLAVNIVFN